MNDPASAMNSLRPLVWAAVLASMFAILSAPVWAQQYPPVELPRNGPCPSSNVSPIEVEIFGRNVDLLRIAYPGYGVWEDPRWDGTLWCRFINRHGNLMAVRKGRNADYVRLYSLRQVEISPGKIGWVVDVSQSDLLPRAILEIRYEANNQDESFVVGGQIGWYQRFCWRDGRWAKSKIGNRVTASLCDDGYLKQIGSLGDPRAPSLVRRLIRKD